MNWNKEKAIFASAVGLTVLTFFLSVRTFLRGVAEIPPTTRTVIEPIGTQTGEAAIVWSPIEVVARPRNPFVAVSDWRPAGRDPLPAPYARRLRTRTPLPPMLSDSKLSRLPREIEMPKEKK